MEEKKLCRSTSIKSFAMQAATAITKAVIFFMSLPINAVIAADYFPVSKMLARQTSNSTPDLLNLSRTDRTALSQGLLPDRFIESITSKTSMEIGVCDPTNPVVVRIGAGSGRGAIGVTSKDTIIKIIIVDPNKNIVDDSIDKTVVEIIGQPELNFFGVENPVSASYVIPVAFQNVPKDGKYVEIRCSQREDNLIVIIRDDSDISVTATMQFDKTNDDVSIVQTLELSDGVESSIPLKGKCMQKTPGNQSINFQYSTKNSIRLQQRYPSSSDAIALVNLEMTDALGGKHPRTLLVRRSNKYRRKPNTATEIVKLLTSSIREIDGDVEFQFDDIIGYTNQYLKYDVRISLYFTASAKSQDVIEISAIVNNNKVIVHNEWFRYAFEQGGYSTGLNNGWDVYVDVIVSDPNDGYSVVGQTNGKIIATGIQNSPWKSKLTGPPTTIEPNDEMLNGRKSETLTRNKKRNLRSGRRVLLDNDDSSTDANHKKLLVHGWCSNHSPWPTSDFTNAIEFVDTTSPGGWSHNEFALKIYNFTAMNNLDVCSCIAHSQGGAACLHLYTYFYSCLDNTQQYGGNRMIQSVGTPYQGTSLAGIVADIGNFLGIVNCGYTHDLTHDGASLWLSGIPIRARKQVYYYTTSFYDRLWKYDYCKLPTDLLLDDPDDGTVEYSGGQLPDGNDCGHKVGWCHGINMNYPAQYHDKIRNDEMNINAKY